MTSDKKQKIRMPHQKRGQDTKEKLILSSLGLFSEKGYHATNSKEIAAKCNVATGSFYAYFKDKKEIFIEAFKYYNAIIESKICTDTECDGHTSEENWANISKELAGCENIKSKLRRLLTNLIKTHELYVGFHREIAVMRLSDSDIRKVVEEQEKKDIYNIMHLVKSMDKTVKVHDPEAAAYILYRALDSAICNIHLSTIKTDYHERIKEEMVEMIYKYFFYEEKNKSKKIKRK